MTLRTLTALLVCLLAQAGTAQAKGVCQQDGDCEPIGPIDTPRARLRITSPREGALLRTGKPVQITWSAVSGDEVVKLEVFAGHNGRWTRQCTATEAPFSCEWEPKSAGPYELRAEATYLRGAWLQSPSVAVTVKDPASPPEVRLTSPLDGVSFRAGSAFVSGLAVAEAGIKEFQVYVDQTPLDAEGCRWDDDSRFRCPWDAREGAHILRAKVTDMEGTTASSELVAVNVTSAFEVSIKKPLPNAKLPVGPTSVEGRASSRHALADITVWVAPEGKPAIDPCPDLRATEHFACPWSPAAAGKYRIYVVATNQAGGQASSPVIEVTVGETEPPRPTLTVKFVKTPPDTASGVYTLSATASEVSTIKFFIDSDTGNGTLGIKGSNSCANATACSATWSTAGLDGTRALIVTAADSAGTVASDKRTVTVKNGKISISATGTDGASVRAGIFWRFAGDAAWKFLEDTPATLAGVVAADYEFKLAALGYKDYTTSLILGLGEEKTIAAKLTPATMPVPTASLTAVPTQIKAGESSVLTWESSNATSCQMEASYAVGYPWYGLKGSEKVEPGADATYTLNCHGAGGSVTKTAKVTVTKEAASRAQKPGTDRADASSPAAG